MVYHAFSLNAQTQCSFAEQNCTKSNGPLVKRPKTPASHAGNMGSNPVRVTISLITSRKGMDRYNQIKLVGVDDGEGPPVPIPNTEVKLTCAENT